MSWICVGKRAARMRFTTAEVLSTSTPELQKQLLKRLISYKMQTATEQLFDSNPRQLPVRELEHTSASSLYTQYKAFCARGAGDANVAGRSLFYSEFLRWSPCLRFRKKSTHSVCFQCSRLRAAIAESKNDFTLHARFCNELLDHYVRQWRDREVYWTCRERAKTVRDVLCVILDSYDKAKAMLPKFPYQRTPKLSVYEKIPRVLAKLSHSILRDSTCQACPSGHPQWNGRPFSHPSLRTLEPNIVSCLILGPMLFSSTHCKACMSPSPWCSSTASELFSTPAMKA